MNRPRAACVVGALCALFSGCPDDPAPAAGWTEAFDATSVGWLMNVWGPAPDDLYAVGGDPSRPDGGVVMHYDGHAWSRVDLGLAVPLMNWCYGFGPGDVTVVGADGTVVHWDGTRWERRPTPTTQRLWGVWGAGPNDMWTVGGNALADGDATLLHWDGTDWSVVTPPAVTRANVFAYFKVWGTSAGNVYAVGQRGIVIHYDGASWTEVDTGLTSSQDLISLWGTGPDHLVIVGGRGNGVVVALDGTTWRTRSLSPLPGLNGIWMRNPGVAHVVGIEGTIATLDFATLDYTDVDTGTRTAYHAIFGDSSGRVTAVGGNLLAGAGPYTGLASTRMLSASE